MEAKKSQAKPASAIVEDMLGVLRRQFYTDRDEQRWHFERELLVKAITFPAWKLEHSKADLPPERYQGIIQEVIRTIQQHGDTSKVRNFGRYFLHAVQEHMKHRWAGYYEESKKLRGALDKAIAGSPIVALAEAHTELLKPKAEAAKVIAVAKGGRRKGSAAKPLQRELF